jgi:hypothetical protein
MKTIKFNSFAALSSLVNHSSNAWEIFLQQRGHTLTTYSYLPEDLKLALNFSFAKTTAEEPAEGAYCD